MIPDQDRQIGIAYGAADSPSDELARRIGFLIDPEGKIAEAHPNVVPAEYPQEQLASLRSRVSAGGSAG